MTTPLKTGEIPSDPRLGRIPQFDSRNRMFGIVPPKQELSPPRSYTWNFEDPFVLDQGQDGACVGFAFGNELRCKPQVVNGITNLKAKELYWDAQKTDDWDGGEYPGASPVYSGTSVLACAKVLKAAGYYIEYRWAFTEAEMAWAVSHKGPAVIGINWYEGMFDPDSSGEVHPTGQVAGGHALAVRGYNKVTRRYLVRNSWGPAWGIGGDCYISAENMARFISEGGDVCIPTRSRKLEPLV